MQTIRLKLKFDLPKLNEKDSFLILLSILFFEFWIV